MSKLKFTKVGNTIKVEDTAPATGVVDIPFNMNVGQITKIAGANMRRQGGGAAGGIAPDKVNMNKVDIFQSTGTFSFTLDDVDTAVHTTWTNDIAGLNIAVAALSAML